MDIASMLEVEVQVQEVDSKENVTPQGTISNSQIKFPCQNYSKEEDDFYKLTYGSDVASVRFLRLHCTGCDEHIGSAPAESHNMHEHPVLRTLLCAKCREFYGDGTFEQGDDATDMFCRWCANGGNLYCCSYCSNTFCSKCIKRNFDPVTIKRIEAEDSWKCFVCDPKDLFPLRSICRALIAHIETVTRILENDRRMSPKDIEEKMHLDETKCCSRKRKRRRRRTLSNSEDDEDEDSSYIPESDRTDTPPVKKRKSRNAVRNSYSNGFYDHEYHSGSRRRTKVEPEQEQEPDPADFLISCEQTMIEGDTEIMNPNDTDDLATHMASKENSPQTLQQRQFSKIAPKNMAINPVPLANLLKVALSTGAKKIKVTHTANQKLVAVPMSVVPKSVASSSITFVKPATHFLVPKSVAKTLQTVRNQQSRLTSSPKEQPSIIDLDSDDEPVILDNNIEKNIIGKINTVNENIDTDLTQRIYQKENNDDDLDSESIIMSETLKTRTNADDSSEITIDEVVPLKTQQRDKRFKKMLQLQSQEIDSTWSELKTKIMKLIQLSNTKSQQDANPLSSAALCTKRFHRALRKALVELSHINDRVVRDFVHWKKKTDKTVKDEKNLQESVTEESKAKDNISSEQVTAKDDLPLEMICVRDSESESEDDDDIEMLVNKERTTEAVEIPAEFTQILDHLSIFKRKPTGVKAVGDSSILMEDKACQAYDVPWRDYEKCIGYSLLSKSEYNSETNEETLRSVVMPNENFGKYQEQFLFYLQHIEDYGIETDETKGLPDPNHIPLKDLIDSTSPFIMDMLERLSPVTLSNGCPSPLPMESTIPKTLDNTSSTVMDTPLFLNDSESQNLEKAVITTSTEEQETENKNVDESAVSTSKAVEELVKMVTKLSEDLRSEQKEKELELEKETISAVNSILEVTEKNKIEVQQRVNDDITHFCETASNNEECTILE